MFQYNSFAFSILNFLYWIKFILKRKLTPLRPKKKLYKNSRKTFPSKSVVLTKVNQHLQFLSYHFKTEETAIEVKQNFVFDETEILF